MPPADDRPVRSGRSRGVPRTLAIAAVVLLALRVATGLWEAKRPPERAERVRWQSISGAEARAAAMRKPVLYDFTADWCGPCQMMKAEVFTDEKLARGIEQLVVPVRVLDRQREEGRNPADVEMLQQRFGVQAFPTLVVTMPGRPEFEKVEGYLGRDGTVRWVAEASMRVRLGARKLPAKP